jgi:tetratricopeptide (TPR) repeat protein
MSFCAAQQCNCASVLYLNSILLFLENDGRVEWQLGRNHKEQPKKIVRYLIVILIAVARPAFADQGIVVVSVSKYSEAANVGIKAGDVLLSWTRGSRNGTFESPFDLMRIEVEQSPLGTVLIEGIRHSQRQRWELWQDWGITSRPAFTPGDLGQYARSRALAEKGELNDAQVLWAAMGLREVHKRRMYSWCSEDTAELLANNKGWAAADILFRKALTGASSDPVVQVFILRKWALSFERRGNWNAATHALHMALGESEAYDSGGLLMASALGDFAFISDWRRDLKTADRLYRQALTIDQKVAPESLVTARSLVMLAMVAIDNGDEQSAHQFLDEAKPILDEISPRGPDAARFNRELGSLSIKQGDLNQAKKYLNEAKDILQNRWPDSLDFAKTLSSLAFIAARQGDLSAAELHLRQALSIYNKQPLDPVLGFNLSNDLSVLAYERSDFAGAKRYELKTESILEELAPTSVDHAGCLMNLGMYALGNDKMMTSR